MKVYLIYDLNNMAAHELIRAFATEEAAAAAVEQEQGEGTEYFINEVDVEN